MSVTFLEEVGPLQESVTISTVYVCDEYWDFTGILTSANAASQKVQIVAYKLPSDQNYGYVIGETLTDAQGNYSVRLSLMADQVGDFDVRACFAYTPNIGLWSGSVLAGKTLRTFQPCTAPPPPGEGLTQYLPYIVAGGAVVGVLGVVLLVRKPR